MACLWGKFSIHSIGLTASVFNLFLITRFMNNKFLFDYWTNVLISASSLFHSFCRKSFQDGNGFKVGIEYFFSLGANNTTNNFHTLWAWLFFFFFAHLQLLQMLSCSESTIFDQESYTIRPRKLSSVYMEYDSARFEYRWSKVDSMSGFVRESSHTTHISESSSWSC